MTIVLFFFAVMMFLDKKPSGASMQWGNTGGN